MNLGEVLRQYPPIEDVSSYCIPVHPPMDATQLSLSAHVGAEEMNELPGYKEGDASVLLSYRGKAAFIMGIAEEEAGEMWKILQLQGVKSKKSYRVANGVARASLMANQFREYVQCDEAEVQRIAMPRFADITNITNSPSIEGVRRTYETTAGLLGMRYSEQEKIFVADVRRSVADTLQHESAMVQ